MSEKGLAESFHTQSSDTSKTAATDPSELQPPLDLDTLLQRVDQRLHWGNKDEKRLAPPRRRYYPQTLRPWLEFPTLCKQTYEALVKSSQEKEYLDEDLDRLLRPMRRTGASQHRGLVQTAIDLADWTRTKRDIVDEPDPIQASIQRGLEPEVEDCLRIETEKHRMSDWDPEVRATVTLGVDPALDPVAQPEQPEPPAKPKEINARLVPEDKALADLHALCSRRNHRIRLIVHFASNRRVWPGLLRAGFRQMQLEKDVLSRVSESQGLKTNELNKQARAYRLQFQADQLCAALATLNFHYMVENGLEYSFVETGENLIFFRIDMDDPSTLLYHVADYPNWCANELAEGHSFHLNPLFPERSPEQTAVAQLMTICALAVRSPVRNQKWRHEIGRQLKKCECDGLTIRPPPVDDNAILVDVQTETKRTKTSKSWKIVKSKISYKLKGKKKPTQPNTTGDLKDPRIDNADDDVEYTIPEPGPGARGVIEHEDEELDWEAQVERYCTLGCLKGMMRGGLIDPSCPFLASHQIENNKHTIDPTKFASLVQEQLAKDMDHNCEVLGHPGTTGALFRITLASHGYRFIGKGTVKAYVARLKREAWFYEKLGPLQGREIPVCMGGIDLVDRYYLTLGVSIRHMLLMGWGGVDMEELERESDRMQDRSGVQMRAALAKMRRLGVVHGDTADRNLLWNKDLKQTLLIDFERALTVEQVEARRLRRLEAREARQAQQAAEAKAKAEAAAAAQARKEEKAAKKKRQKEAVDEENERLWRAEREHTDKAREEWRKRGEEREEWKKERTVKLYAGEPSAGRALEVAVEIKRTIKLEAETGHTIGDVDQEMYGYGPYGVYGETREKKPERRGDNADDEFLDWIEEVSPERYDDYVHLKVREMFTPVHIKEEPESDEEKVYIKKEPGSDDDDLYGHGPSSTAGAGPEQDAGAHSQGSKKRLSADESSRDRPDTVDRSSKTGRGSDGEPPVKKQRMVAGPSGMDGKASRDAPLADGEPDLNSREG